MAGTALAKSKTIVPGEAEDPETYFGFVRLFVLCRAGDGAISVQRVAEDLAHRGLVVGTRSVQTNREQQFRTASQIRSQL